MDGLGGGCHDSDRAEYYGALSKVDSEKGDFTAWLEYLTGGVGARDTCGGGWMQIPSRSGGGNSRDGMPDGGSKTTARMPPANPGLAVNMPHLRASGKKNIYSTIPMSLPRAYRVPKETTGASEDRRWLVSQNLSPYKGKWIAIAHKSIVASGVSLKAVLR